MSDLYDNTSCLRLAFPNERMPSPFVTKKKKHSTQTQTRFIRKHLNDNTLKNAKCQYEDSNCLRVPLNLIFIFFS
jgi:hypothetical protein